MSQSNPTSARETNPANLNRIRLALIGGAALIGAVFWFLAQQSGEPMLDAKLRATARWAVLAAFGAAALALLVIRQKWRAAEAVTQQQSLNITGWALAEAMTFVGAIYVYLAGDPAFFIVGLLAQLVVSFVLLPVPAQDE